MTLPQVQARALVTGAGGMLGSALVPELVRQGFDVRASDLRADLEPSWGRENPALDWLDVRKREQVADGIERQAPDIVFHLAAMTDLEECEADPDGAYHTNAMGTKHVALACARAGIPMVYISTAGVFDGLKDGVYTEYDEPLPINAYGGSKLAGERTVQTFLDRFYIVRAGWMVGGGARDHKFVARIADQIRSGAKEIHAVTDKLGTPTYAPDFARCLLGLVRTDSYGLYHMVSEGPRASRYDVAKRILRALGRDDIELREVDSSFFAEQFPAPRPPSEMMRNLNLELQGLNTMRPWDVAIDEYLQGAFGDLGLRPEGVAAGAEFPAP
jgi:dTDP-4-dehydrorhamnose reductase